MPKDTKTLGNNKARACESLGFVHKKRLCQRFDTTSSLKRRLPTLPLLRSTIGVTRLNFSVRNGKRWNPRAITT